MVQNPPLSHSNTDEQLYLIGFCLQNSEEPDCYTLITSGGDYDRPLMKETSLLFFNEPLLAHKALAFSTNDLIECSLSSSEVALTCYVQKMIVLIKDSTIDNSSVILNCLNTFFDLLGALDISLPENYRLLLYSFADHLTFHREFGSFIQSQQFEKDHLLDAVSWCIEKISSRNKFLTSQGWKEYSPWEVCDLLKTDC